MTIVTGTGLVAYLDEDHVLALTPSLPRDRESYVACIGHGVVEPHDKVSKVTVSVVCEELGDEGFEPLETPAPGESCTRCSDVTAQDDISCKGLGSGDHEIRTKAHGTLTDDNGPHQPDEVYSQSIVVSCETEGPP